MVQFFNRGDLATKAGFGEGVVLAGERYPEIVVFGADITASVGLDIFAERFPDRFFSLGIAEQNCAGVAAGVALSGKIPVFSTYGVFAALRAADQIRVSLCYNNVHAIIGGAHAGISVGPDGATHQALEDIAIMRVLPKLTILSPCDATQAKLAVLAAVEQVTGPVYIRFGRVPVPNFTTPDMRLISGRGQVLYDGTDVSIIATGHMVWEALQASYKLEKEGIRARVINIHTIKPLDDALIIKAAMETGAIVAAEEHQVTGGLGSAIAETLVRNFPVPVEFIGMPDCFGESGQADELMVKFGLNTKNIIASVRKVLMRKSDKEG